MNKKEFNKAHQHNLSELKKLLKSFTLGSTGAQEDYLELCQQLLVKLDNGDEAKKIENFLRNELVVTYGLFNHEFDAKILAKSIIGWYNSLH